MTAHRLIAESDQIQELAEVVGRDAAERLCAGIGGTKTYIPRVIDDDHEIGRILDRREADLLAEHFHGTFMELPKAFQRRARALQLVKEGKLTQRAAALQTDYTERHIRRLVKAEDDGQLDLFKNFMS